MKSLFPVAIVIALTCSGVALASDDCNRPMTDWLPRDTVEAHVTEMGITTERLRIDDGCYEVRGRDDQGNRIELKIDPSTLALLKLEVRFHPGADPSRYLPAARSQTARQPDSQTARQLSTPSTAAQTDTN